MAANGITSISFMAEGHFAVCVYHSFLVHSPVDGHSGRFRGLVIAAGATADVGCMCLSE